MHLAYLVEITYLVRTSAALLLNYILKKWVFVQMNTWDTLIYAIDLGIMPRWFKNLELGLISHFFSIKYCIFKSVASMFWIILFYVQNISSDKNVAEKVRWNFLNVLKYTYLSKVCVLLGTFLFISVSYLY